jgi:hypothetical protein
MKKVSLHGCGSELPAFLFRPVSREALSFSLIFLAFVRNYTWFKHRKTKKHRIYGKNQTPDVKILGVQLASLQKANHWVAKSELS